MKAILRRTGLFLTGKPYVWFAVSAVLAVLVQKWAMLAMAGGLAALAYGYYLAARRRRLELQALRSDLAELWEQMDGRDKDVALEQWRADHLKMLEKVS